MPNRIANRRSAIAKELRLSKAAAYDQAFVFSVFFLALLLLLWCGQARAEDGDPFALDTTNWKSLDRFQEDLKKSPQKIMPANPPKADNSMSEEVDEPKKVVEAEKPAPAPLTRPISIPLMPGVNKGYDVHVTSTAEAVETTESQNRAPGTLNSANWQKAEDAANQMAKKNGAGGIDEPAALNVRMSFLPDRAVVPVNSPEKRKLIRPTTLAEMPKPKTPAEAATCAAIDADKKRQLQAIQNDQKTLQALQAAIQELGLNKDLDFLTNASINGTNQASQNTERMAPSLPGVRSN